MLEDFRLKVFVTVAAAKSFTKAAEALGVSQPAISQNVAELEKMTGRKLFDRMRGETLLTPAGEVFLKYARNILSATSQAELVFSDLDVTSVRFGACEDVFNDIILPSLEGLIAVHPEVTVERSSADDCDIIVSMVPSASGTSNSFELAYKPIQAFVFTKTCMVLKNILGF